EKMERKEQEIKEELAEGKRTRQEKKIEKKTEGANNKERQEGINEEEGRQEK
ncbi:15923_t:CDS:2, partial [Racocetra fulgida]